MIPSVDANEFLNAVRPALARSDAGALIQIVNTHWLASQIGSLVHHRCVEVRRVASLTLGLVGGSAEVGWLVSALHDKDEQVQRLAERGMWTIWFRGGSDKAAKPFREGCRHLAAECYEAAVEQFHDAGRIDHEFSEAFNQCAIAHFFLGQWRKSLADCSRTIRTMPPHFGAIAGMGHCYAELGDLSRALVWYRKAQRVNPRMPAISRAIERLECRIGAIDDMDVVLDSSSTDEISG